MIRRVYSFVIFLFLLFFSFVLKGNAQSYIIKDDVNERDSHCPKSERTDFSCGDYKRIESCKQIKIEVCSGAVCDGDSYDGEVYISAYIFIHEVGYFEFGHISSVYAGKGFNFPNVSYKRNVYWDYYRDYEKIILSDARQGFNKSDLTEAEINKYKGMLDKAASDAFDNYLRDYNNVFFQKNIMVKANDSNEYIKTVNKDEGLKKVLGNWSKIFEERQSDVVNEGDSSAVSQEFEYSFCDAYVNLSGSNFSDVEYICDIKNLGDNYSGGYSKYFVPLLYPDDKAFYFNVVNNGDKSYLNINGTCKIDVVNELFDYADNGDVEPRYHYRPIDINNPFPDGKVADNWKKYSVEEYFSRLRNSYDTGFYYKVVLVGGTSNDGKISMNRIENRNYNDWTNIDSSGESKFVENFYKNNGGSYCNIGQFNDGCDIYRDLGSDGL